MLSLLQTMRERSIASRAEKLTLPPLNDPARIHQGAGNYNAMCTGCSTYRSPDLPTCSTISEACAIRFCRIRSV